MVPVSSTSAEVTITKLQMLFATHGIPDHIVSNNGLEFVCEEFRKFTSDNGIMHITSPVSSIIKWIGRACCTDF